MSNRIKGTDTTTKRNYSTIIDGECQYCGGEFTFDPNNVKGNTFYGSTDGNWRVRMDSKNRPRKYAVCPYCGHHNETNIFV
jgi:hypothetical protein